jgi:hypothetical protein
MTIKLKELSVLKLNAPYDRNGNGQKLYMVMHPEAGIMACIEDRCRSDAALNDLGVTLGKALSRQIVGYLDVSAKQFNELLRDFWGKKAKSYATPRLNQLFKLDEKLKKKAQRENQKAEGSTRSS